MQFSRLVPSLALALACCNDSDPTVADAGMTDAVVADAATTASDASPDALVTPPDDLPAPATDTVEMSLNGTRVTLVSKRFCRDGATGIGFEHTAEDPHLPTLFVHGIDFADPGPVVLTVGGAWHVDIDDTIGVWGPTDEGCMATVVESSATVYELSAVACEIKNQFGPQTGTVSFRARCTKGT